MPKGQKPDYKVMVGRETEGQKTFWTQIGAAWKISKGISISLDAVPINGKLTLFETDAE